MQGDLTMPAASKKQGAFMKAVANNPKFAKKVGVPAKVGKEFAKPAKKGFVPFAKKAKSG
jgi:hypothetical protein